MTRGWWARTAGLLLLTAVAGCTSTVEGTASPATTVEPTPTTSSAPATTEPSEPPLDIIPPPPRGVGLLLEAHRIASVTALVETSFPDRTEACFPSGPSTSPDALESVYFTAGTAAGILEDYGFVTAWGQCNQTADGSSATLTLVMELSDPEAAARAANELVDAQAIDGFQVVPVETDGGALLLQEGDRATVQAFLPFGRTVAYVWHEGLASAAAADLTRLLADQEALLRNFTPTPQADVPNLPTDPDGLQAMTLDPPGDFNDFSGPYDFEGYLRIAIDPGRERELLGANGFAGFYAKQSDEGDALYAVAVYRFGSTEQTNAVYNGFRELETTAFGGTPFVLPAIPEAPCFVFDQGGGQFYQRCYVGFRTLLASVDVGGLTAADDYTRMNELLPAQRALIAD
ncbi:DUF7373 family lipoprotein [Trujillonella endophytica]|uniref:DUF7373 domain-containing protein n=1 Tax=Trujillonella endophytica TaxID=673521 RepID=A0A1H8RNP0_9ACTN|nr:hypothetical protein [Trujillella endophytica]SEO67985.1 hypothetical protein SAMN05660991_01235 [Trujillella endophytica]